MLLRINGLLQITQTLPRTRCAWNLYTSTRVASTASTTTRHAAAPRRRTPVKTPQYKPLRPEDHQEPEAKYSNKYPIPETLQIYHCGAARATITGTLKFTNLISFTGSYAYGFYQIYEGGSAWPSWAVGSTILGLLAWTGLYAYVSSPLVLNARLKIPRTARYGGDALRRWLKHLPGDTPFELTTMRFHGGRKTTGVLLRELRPYAPPWWRMANIERVTVDREGTRIEVQDTRPLWRKMTDWTAEPRYRFYINPSTEKTLKKQPEQGMPLEQMLNRIVEAGLREGQHIALLKDQQEYVDRFLKEQAGSEHARYSDKSLKSLR